MDGGKRGEGKAAHLHIVVNGIDHISHIIRDLWEKGWICIKPLDKSGQYRKLAGYFIKYSDKTMKTEQGFINKRYCSSKNLIIQNRRKRRSGDGTPITIKLRFRPDGTWIRRASGRLGTR